jgi:hypothetical protein
VSTTKPPSSGEGPRTPASEPTTRALVPTQRSAALARTTQGFATTQGFIARFVMPLLGGREVGGGEVEVAAPLSRYDRDAMLEDSGALLHDGLIALRSRVAARFVAEPALDHPEADELSLWIAIHDLLALDHPDQERVWTRASTWTRVEVETRELFVQAAPAGLGDALARHLAVNALLELRRVDRIVSGPEGERRYFGQMPPRRLALFGPSLDEVRSETLVWVEQPHRPVVVRLLEQAMWISPLTALLRPARAPASWSPLAICGGVAASDFLRLRGSARAVCHAWAREREWPLLGGVLAGSLLDALGLARTVFGGPLDSQLALPARSPSDEARSVALDDSHESVAALLGALIHLHVLKVLEFDARIGLGLGDRNWAVQAFLALPLLLPKLAMVLGDPFAGVADDSLARRWSEYREHLGGLVPRTVVDNLAATLVPRAHPTLGAPTPASALVEKPSP